MAQQKPQRSFGRASAWICPDHAEIANRLRGKNKQGDNLYAGAAMGVLTHQIDSYVLAASIGFALRECTDIADYPERPRSNPTTHGWKEINEATVMRNDGAKQLCILVGLLSHVNNPDIFETDVDDDRLELQIDELTKRTDDEKDAWVNRIALLDRYAHRGFEWLESKLEDHMSMEDLIFSSLEIELKGYEAEESSNKPGEGFEERLARSIKNAS